MKNNEYKIKSEVINGDFDKISGSLQTTGWLDEGSKTIYQEVSEDVDILTKTDITLKKDGLKSLKVIINSFDDVKSNADNSYINLSILLKARLSSFLDNIEIPFSSLQERIKKITLELSYFVNSSYKGSVENHKIRFRNSKDKKDNILFETDFELNTKGDWYEYKKTFDIYTRELIQDYIVEILIEGKKENFKGEANFDQFKLKFVDLDLINKENDLEFNDPIFLPIPFEYRSAFESFLNECGITDYEINSLINDPSYSFAALMELFKREGLSFKDFQEYINGSYPKLADQISTYLSNNGVAFVPGSKRTERVTLGDLLLKDHGDKLTQTLLLYSRALLTPIAPNVDELIEGPIENTSSQLLNIVKAVKEKTNDINQLRTLDLLESSLDKVTNKVDETIGNVLTADEQLGILPSLTETQKVSDELYASAKYAVEDLIDRASRDRIPEYEFRIGDESLPLRSQQKMNYLADILHAINPDNHEVDYSGWIPGYFGGGGDVANDIIGEAAKRNMLKNTLEASIANGLEKYSTVDAIPPLKNYISSELADEIADEGYKLKDTFRTFGEVFGAIASLFETREHDSFENIIKNKTEKITKDAIEKGYHDNEGNFHEPLPVNSDVSSFASSAASTAAYEGMKSIKPALDEIPTNITSATGINPVGDFHPDSLGSVFYPNDQRGLANEPITFTPSVPSRLEENLKDTLSPKAINSLQKEVMQNPELFKNTRFDGDFTKIPEVQNALKDGGVSDFKMPQVKDAINNAFGKNNFDKVDKGFDRLAAVGNETLGNINKRLGVPFDDDSSPMSNLFPLLGAPFTKGADALSKSVFGNQAREFFNENLGSSALASKGVDLPNNYSPEVLQSLMANQAPFTSPVPQQNFIRPQDPDMQNKIKQYQEYQKAMQQQSYGQKRPKQSRSRDVFREIQEDGERMRKALQGTSVGGATGGALLGFAVASPAIAIPFTVLGGAASKIIGTALGTEKSKVKEYYNTVLDMTGISGATKAIEYKMVNGRRVVNFIKANTLWNRTLGRVFGYDYEAASISLDENDEDLTSGLDQDLHFWEHPVSKGPLWAHFFIKAYNETDPVKQQEYQKALELASTFHRWYYKFLQFNFSDKSYWESIGILGGTYEIGTSINKTDIADTSIEKQAETYELINPYNPTSKSKLSGFRSIRSGLGKFYNGFLGLSKPLREDSRMIDALNFFLLSIPNGVMSFGEGLQSLYSVLPVELQKTISRFSFFGKKDDVVTKSFAVRLHDGSYLRQRFTVRNRRTGQVEVRERIYRHQIVVGYKTSLGKAFDFIFGKTQGKLRDGWRYILAGHQSSKYKFFVTRWYFRGVNGLNKTFSFITNPFKYISNTIKNYLQNLILRLTKKLVEAIFKTITKTLAKVAIKLGASVGKVALATLGIGCLIIGGVVAITLIAVIATTSAVAPAYGVSSNLTVISNNDAGIVPIIPVGSYTCPLKGNIVCTQGPRGTPGTFHYVDFNAGLREMDLSASSDNIAYAVETGTLVYGRTLCDGSRQLELTGANGKYKYIYLHTRPTIADGGTVQGGQELGKLILGPINCAGGVQLSSGTHLHIVLYDLVAKKYMNPQLKAKKGGEWNCGIQSDSLNYCSSGNYTEEY